MKTKSLFALLGAGLSLALTACPSSENRPTEALPSEGETAEPMPEPTVSCIYEVVNRSQCGTSDVPEDVDTLCASQCPETDLEYAYDGFCETNRLTRRPRRIEGTCDEYEDAVRAGRQPEVLACDAPLDLRECSECGNFCCNKVQECAESKNCTEYLACAFACDDAVGGADAKPACQNACKEKYPFGKASIESMKACFSLNDCSCGSL